MVVETACHVITPQISFSGSSLQVKLPPSVGEKQLHNIQVVRSDLREIFV